MANRPNWNQSGDERDMFEDDDLRGLAEDEADEPTNRLEDDEAFSDEDENETDDQ
jgi:hypothetical protein